MNGLDSVKYQKSREGTHWELNELLMRMRQNNNSAPLLHFGDNGSGWTKCAESSVFGVLERERAHSL